MDKDMTVRIGAAEVLGKLGDHRALQPLTFLQDDPFSDVRNSAQAAIVRPQQKIILNHFHRTWNKVPLPTPSPGIRRHHMRVFIHIRNKSLV